MDLQQAEALYAKRRAAALDGGRYINLQVGDNDLIGNKFNGHDLHLLLQKRGVRAFHCVINKESADRATFALPMEDGADLAWKLLHSEAFLLADVVHLHLIHNTDFDLGLLPLMTRLKPTVITLHDPFFLGGHCIHSFGCDKWRTHCHDCPHLGKPFVLERDDTALRFARKRQMIQDSRLNVIVASAWMEDKVRQSPIFAGKKVYQLPFGIDQTIFCPGDARKARRALGVPEDGTTVLFRADKNPYKGLDVIKAALQRLDRTPLTLLTVGTPGLLGDLAERYTIKEFGWLKDDKTLATLYRACNLFLAPSRQEAFGMMAIEAMSCGKTVLATTGTSLPGVIHAPECGVAVAEAAYADALQRLLDDPAEREAHEAASLAYARANYGLEPYLEGMERVYEETMAAHAPDAAARESVAYALAVAPQFRAEAKEAGICDLCAHEMLPLSVPSFKRQRLALETQLGQLQASIRSYENSLSWRMTAPLRRLKKRLRRKK